RRTFEARRVAGVRAGGGDGGQSPRPRVTGSEGGQRRRARRAHPRRVLRRRAQRAHVLPGSRELRAADRLRERREHAARRRRGAATGADRSRLRRQVLTENLLLSLVAGSAGLALAFWGIRLFGLIVPEDFPNLLRNTPIDTRVLVFALGTSVASSLLFGLVPALRTSRLDLNEVLKEGAAGAGGGRRARPQLLVIEVSLSMVLLVGAGLMLRGFLHEQRSLPGFDTDRLLTTDILLGGTRYFDKTPADMNLVTPQTEIFYDRLLQQVRGLPGVHRAAIIIRPP